MTRAAGDEDEFSVPSCQRPPNGATKDDLIQALTARNLDLEWELEDLRQQRDAARDRCDYFVGEVCTFFGLPVGWARALDAMRRRMGPRVQPDEGSARELVESRELPDESGSPEVTDDIERLEPHAGQLEGKVKVLDEQAARLQAEVEDHDGEMERLRSENGRLEKEVERLTDEATKSRDAASHHEAALHSPGAVEAARDLVADLERRVAELRRAFNDRLRTSIFSPGLNALIDSVVDDERCLDKVQRIYALIRSAHERTQLREVCLPCGSDRSITEQNMEGAQEREATYHQPWDSASDIVGGDARLPSTVSLKADMAEVSRKVRNIGQGLSQAYEETRRWAATSSWLARSGGASRSRGRSAAPSRSRTRHTDL